MHSMKTERGSLRTRGCITMSVLTTTLCLIGWIAPLGAQTAQGASGPVLRTLESSSLRRLGIRRVADAAIDRAGHIYLLDDSRPRIAVVDVHLRPVASFDGSTPGVGRLREPIALGVMDDGEVVVLDRAQRMITLFRLSGRVPSLVPSRAFPTDGAAEGMCIVGGNRILLYGLRGNLRLRLMDAQGHQIASMAPADSALVPRAQDLLAQGKMACNTTRDEVLLTSKFLPVVEAYRLTTGKRLWTDTLAPFRPLDLEVQSGGGVSITSGHAGFSLIASVLDLSACWMLQTRFDSRLDSATVDTVVSYTLRASQDRSSTTRQDLPLLIGLSTTRVIAIGGPDPSAVSLDRLDPAACTSGRMNKK